MAQINRHLRSRLAIVAALCGLLAACAGSPATPQGPLAQQRFLPLTPPPQISVRAEADMADALAAVRRVARDSADATAPRIEAVAEPFLYGSPLGRRYLALAPARALALGDPAERCPAAGLGHDAGARGGAGAQAAAGQALRQCLAMTEGRADCGCRLMALDDMLLAGPLAFTYAPGVGGRLVGGGAGGRGAPLTVAERATDDPARTLIGFFDASGPVAVGEVNDDGGARLVLTRSGAVFEGARERRGWRRGRIMERLLLSDAEGRRIIALIGFEPADIVAEGAALAAWPKG